MNKISCLILYCFLTSLCNKTYAQEVNSGLVIPFKLLGKIKPRSANSIKSSIWSVGGETLDRDYANYNSYKRYLGPLGAKRIRLQSGWAKTETIKGIYNWLWLDSVVNDAIAQGVKPWMQIGYGNKIYEGGGTAAIGSPLPSSAEARKAWDIWLAALINRYKDRIDEWEIWNEVDHQGDQTPAAEYGDFYVRTGEIIRFIQPKAKLIALALTTGGFMYKTYAEQFLSYMAGKKKLGLVDAITFHYYAPVPEKMPEDLMSFKVMTGKYSKSIKFWQGESGCPSTGNSSGGLREYNWSELSQAKYILRRMMNDRSQNLELSSIFQISDMIGYNGKTNSKGLLRANPDKTIAYAKPAYYAMQHVTSIFDDHLILNSSSKITTNIPDSISIQRYTNQKNGTQTLSIVLSRERPSDEQKIKLADISVSACRFKKPVYVDLLSGKIYEIPAMNVKRDADKIVFLKLPVTDFPVLIAERSSVLGN
ncbi:hypothetical protein HDC92_004898 [Pedobacter sp. AK017]|uniref:hypothetical protein n=1 Tax=Pedobacter sp. AK017 TaxID=2723073 RepID=UPI00160C1706|nr:hypothetical protein [Pedobacter sp. AK017]MBB5441191.1 hypothetical protein [Pedobacter sp. AK017]